MSIDTTVESTLSAQLHELWSFRELLRNFIQRDIKSQVKQSLLGYTWIFLPPLFQMGVFTFLFTGVLKVHMTEKVPYKLFLMSTLIPWQMFANMLNQATASLVSHSTLLKQIYFPRETIVLSAIVAEGIKTLIACTILAALMIYYQVPPSLELLWLPVLIAFQLLFTLGLSLPLALFNGFARDISKGIQVILTFWMYLTPVVYPIEKVPEAYRKFFILNPMSAFIQGYKRVLLDHQPPELIPLAVAAAISTVIFAIGYYVFKRCEAMMADII